MAFIAYDCCSSCLSQLSLHWSEPLVSSKLCARINCSLEGESDVDSDRARLSRTCACLFLSTHTHSLSPCLCLSPSVSDLSAFSCLPHPVTQPIGFGNSLPVAAAPEATPSGATSSPLCWLCCASSSETSTQSHPSSGERKQQCTANHVHGGDNRHQRHTRDTHRQRHQRDQRQRQAETTCGDIY